MDCPIQLINGDGDFQVTGLDEFSKKVKLDECGLSYAVVSIVGPQSSGKSTILNHLFGTRFPEMNAQHGRSQTTKGIWIAKSIDIKPCTLVIDLEGSDGKEREEDVVFEKRSALFALGMSDVVLINMWCTDVGRENAGGRPLLWTVFEETMHLVNPRKTTLLFLLRDKTPTPPELLEEGLRKDIREIFDSVPKPHDRQKQTMDQIFNVEVICLSHYDYMKAEFNEQVSNLRLLFNNSIAPGGLAGDQTDKLPASDFSWSAQKAWGDIKENKNLNLPTHKVMVATIRCEDIANEQFDHFAENKEWICLKEAVQFGPVLGFRKKLDSIIHTCLSNIYNLPTNPCWNICILKL